MGRVTTDALSGRVDAVASDVLVKVGVAPLHGRKPGTRDGQSEEQVANGRPDEPAEHGAADGPNAIPVMISLSDRV